jgi:hypothetical protein
MAPTGARIDGRSVDAAHQFVLAVAGMAVAVILLLLLSIARRDRGLAGGRTSQARTIAETGPMAHETPAATPARAPPRPRVEPLPGEVVVPPAMAVPPAMPARANAGSSLSGAGRALSLVVAATLRARRLVVGRRPVGRRAGG